MYSDSVRRLVVAGYATLLALACAAPAPAANPLLGTWGDASNQVSRRTGIFSLLTIAPGGRVRIHTWNSMGMAYDLFGSYQMDATGRTMRFTWTDYAPKQICVGGNCTPMQPPQRLGVAHTSRIQFRTPNLFVGTTEDGTSTQWVRTR
jgi:hypothetical protein